VNPLARIRRSVLAERARERILLAGRRVAGLGAAALATAGALRRVPRDASGRDGARERALVLRDASRRVLDLHGLAVEATGAIPLGPALLVSNHLSWLDPLVVSSLLPCVPVSKLDVASWPLLGNLARELGVVFVSRGDAGSGARALFAAGAALGQGLCVLNFPEGTTTRGETVLPFRTGMFGLARRAGVPVVPLTIRYEPASLAWVGDATFLPHYLAFAGRRSARAVVRIGAPVPVAPGRTARDVAQTTRDEVLRMLEEGPWASSLPSTT
jgi:1-acyl-sn-glycerol-3-phosphate acyltransferase